jgi:hypothetical protein
VIAKAFTVGFGSIKELTRRVMSATTSFVHRLTAALMPIGAFEVICFRIVAGANLSD